VLAYYFASKVVAFIDQRWGFDVFPKMLAAWGQRKPTPVVFREVLGVSLSEFDADLKAFLEGTLLVAFRDEYEPVTGADADEISQTYISARQALEEKDYPRASALLDEVLAAGKEGAILRITRAQAAMGAKDWTTAREHLERALSLDPQRSTAYRLLREVLGELGDSDGMYALMKQASLQSEHDVELLVQIMEEARRRNNLDDRQVYSERAIHIAPFVPQLRVIRGEVALSEENYERALAEADLALTLTDGADLVSAHLLRARALKGLGQSEAARAALDGLDSDPQIESLRGELSP
jgi:tetratricopeptide (TPR) repeat protein